MAKDYDSTLFKTIFDQTPVSTQIFTVDGETWMVNKAWEKLWNVKITQIGAYNILKDEQLVETGVMPYIKRAFAGEVVTLPINKYEPSKTAGIHTAVPYKWVTGQMYPIKNKDKQILFIVLQHIDVTEKTHSEVIKNRLAAIIESSDDAIVSKNLNGIINSWNKSAERMFGYKAAEAIGQHVTLIIPKELIKEEETIIKRLKEGKRIHHFHTVRLTKSGQRINVSLSISPIKDNTGTIIGASKIARDITKQTAAERSLKESEERLRIALEAGNIGVWDWHITEDSLVWTDNVYSIHGVTRKSFSPSFEKFKDLIHPDDVKSVSAALQESLQSKTEFIAQFRIITPAGETRWVYTRALGTYDADGKPVRMLGATSDITQQKLLDQEKSDFLSMASHELKTPLTSMKMFVDLLYKELSKQDLDKPLYFIKRIRDQTTRLTRLTNDLLDVSRIETGKLQLNLEEFDLTTLVRETVEGMQTSSEHIIDIKGESTVMVTADSYRIYQVLVNLLTNAIKYSSVNKKIELQISTKNNRAVVSVKDGGIGIALSKQKRIFERLYQVTDPEEKTFPGLGLGLYISKEIIDRHQGTIWVKSKRGKGTTFYFSIPIKIEKK